ncbi:hypothetical protein GCM10023153_02250 [Ornithinibacter aureus]|uniref:Uncharacterized protein n=1 Tax=Ornithinibacter aureus TaxID=622664 RepID=A0ABP8JA91_9MICO
MSVIAIVSGSTSWPTKAALEFKNVTGVAPSKVRSDIEARRPIFERELFMNDHNAVAGQLRSIIKIDSTYWLGLEYSKLQPGQNFDTAPLGPAHIDAEILENMLSAAAGEFEDEI